MAFEPWFMSDVESFLDEAERSHEPRLDSGPTRGLEGLAAGRITPHRGEGKDATRIDCSMPRPAAENQIAELQSQIADMQSTTTWRWARRYWRLRARLQRLLRA
jgi:hypothetical protein